MGVNLTDISIEGWISLSRLDKLVAGRIDSVVGGEKPAFRAII